MACARPNFGHGYTARLTDDPGQMSASKDYSSLLSFPNGATGKINALAHGDFNGDGLDDMAAADEVSQTILVWLRRAKNDAAALASGGGGRSSTGARPTKTTTADDIFEPAQRVIFAPGIKHMISADFDGDGKIDLASTWGTSDIVAWHRNMGGGSFVTKIIDNLCERPGVLKAIANERGQADLFVVSRGTDVGAIYAYTSSNAADSTTALLEDAMVSIPLASKQMITSVDSPIDLVLGDFSGSGYDDMVIASPRSGFVWLRRRPNGDFVREASPGQLGTGCDRPKSLAVGDMDLDGLPDIVAACEKAHSSNSNSNGGGSSDVILWYDSRKGMAYRQLGPAPAVGIDSVLTLSPNIATKRVDVLAMQLGGNLCMYYRNLGIKHKKGKKKKASVSGGIGFEAESIALPHYAHKVWLYDANGDGSMDLVYAPKRRGTHALHTRINMCCDASNNPAIID